MHKTNDKEETTRKKIQKGNRVIYLVKIINLLSAMIQCYLPSEASF